MGMGLNALRDANFAVFKEKGWVDERTFGDDMALIASELSEALEDFRNGAKLTEIWYERKVAVPPSIKDQLQALAAKFLPIEPPPVHWITIKTRERSYVAPDGSLVLNKPCGIPSELADVVIRLLNLCAMRGIDIEAAVEDKMAYNATRPARHGGKKL